MEERVGITMRKKGLKHQMMAFALLLSLGAGILAGCGNNGVKKEETTSSNPETVVTTDETTPTGAADEKPEEEVKEEAYAGFTETPMDLGGRTIRFITTAASRYTYAEDKDTTSNETLEIIAALETIEKDYNCTIEVEQLKGRDMVEALVTSKSAGDVYGDILEFGASDTYLEDIYSANLVMPLEDAKIADIIKLDGNPWLPASDFGRMFGHQYGVHFKTNNSGDLLRGVVLFNQELVNKYNLGDMYELVDKKEWTFEKFEELCANVASQSDGSVYPMLYNQEGIFIPMLIYANGGTVAEYTDKGYQFTALQDNTIEAINFAQDLAKNGYIHPESENRSTNETNFANGEAVFYFTNYASLKKYTQGTIPMEDSVGLLPGPLGTNGDSNYNAVSYTEAMFHVMNNVEKPEEVAAVLVAIANRTGKVNMIETELMNTLQDEKSAEILEMMYNNMICDFSRAISKSRSPISGANKSIMLLEKTPKEAYEEIAGSIQTIFDELTLAK
jgi:ABC-type glycerol-3-phosphate transport system substrate-binding protein